MIPPQKDAREVAESRTGGYSLHGSRRVHDDIAGRGDRVERVADRTTHDREVHPDWAHYPRYVADRAPQAGGEPTLRCADCSQTAYELFHGRCAPCAIQAEIPLRQRDREAYASRVREGMSPTTIRHVRPVVPPKPLPLWHWRRWWPWAQRRRMTDRVDGQ